VIVVVEGCTGSGKSTLAAEIAQNLGYKVFRMMNRQSDRNIEELVQLNTYHEDIYAMDALARLDANVVCDRFLPSGLAHDERLSPGDRDVLMMWWAERLAGVKGLLVCVSCDPAVASARSRHDHFSPVATAREQDLIAVWCRKAQALGVKTHFARNATDVNQLFRVVLGWIRNHRSLL
jgi:thymidylate kinase